MDAAPHPPGDRQHRHADSQRRAIRAGAGRAAGRQGVRLSRSKQGCSGSRPAFRGQQPQPGRPRHLPARGVQHRPRRGLYHRRHADVSRGSRQHRESRVRNARQPRVRRLVGRSSEACRADARRPQLQCRDPSSIAHRWHALYRGGWIRCGSPRARPGFPRTDHRAQGRSGGHHRAAALVGETDADPRSHRPQFPRGATRSNLGRRGFSHRRNGRHPPDRDAHRAGSSRADV